MALHQSSLSLIGKSSFMTSPGGFKIELYFTNFFSGFKISGNELLMIFNWIN